MGMPGVAGCAVAAVAAGVGLASVAQATEHEWGLNGSYPTECTGTVVSDFGWTATIHKTGGVWYVKHTVQNWVPCPDGTAAPGLQVFRFVPVNEDGSLTDPASTTLAGEDQTTGPSGACGVSKPVFINMPFKLVKVG